MMIITTHVCHIYIIVCWRVTSRSQLPLVKVHLINSAIHIKCLFPKGTITVMSQAEHDGQEEHGPMQPCTCVFFFLLSPKHVEMVTY